AVNMETAITAAMIKKAGRTLTGAVLIQHFFPDAAFSNHRRVCQKKIGHENLKNTLPHKATRSC
ncbi:MAG: hypothetical protein M1455_05255, partial [Actinobacteria bacterium]|nr:hypothetical protein [Actinomycetota bacterium]